jgi:S1-C subfamily serine protease
MFRHVPLISAVIGTSAVLVLQCVVQAQSAQDVAKIGKAISVNIETDPLPDGSKNLGSGVIIQKQGNLYTVLTAAHVLKDGKSVRLTAAADGQSYAAIAGSVKIAGSDIDLAVVQFRSSQNYQVAKIGNSNLLKSGMNIYISGFPVTSLTTERVWMFTEGKVTANSDKKFKGGYSLIYDINALPGMSGSAMFNQSGELVAIHGKGDRSADGQKTGFNLGIPINRFGQVVKQLGVTVAVEVSAVPTNALPKADDFYFSG